MNRKIEEYITKYSNSLSKFCASLCSSRDDANDLFQSTWEKAIRKFKSYDDSRPFDKWLFTLCINCFRDMNKSSFRKKRLNFRESTDQDSFLEQIPDDLRDTDDYLTLKEEIDRLSPEKREVIILYYYKDCSIEEMSQILSLPCGTVKSRLHAAREQLKRRLK